jgi:hypothetical protein
MTNDNHATDASPHAASASAPAKRAYKKPLLIEFGDVREFTKGPGGSKLDSKSGGFG